MLPRWRWLGHRAMRILLAEDEHTLGTWLCKALEHAGIQCRMGGRRPAGADRALQQRDHDALVLDLGLPGSTATRCCSGCANATSGCPR